MYRYEYIGLYWMFSTLFALVCSGGNKRTLGDLVVASAVGWLATPFVLLGMINSLHLLSRLMDYLDTIIIWKKK